MDEILLEIDPEVLSTFLDESQESLNALDELFVQLEREPANQELASNILRPLHSLKGNAPFFGLVKTKTLAHEIESILMLIRDGRAVANKAIITKLLSGVDELKNVIERIRRSEPEVVDPERFDGLILEIKGCPGQSAADIAAAWTEIVGAISNIERELNSESVKAEFAKLKFAIDRVSPDKSAHAPKEKQSSETQSALPAPRQIEVSKQPPIVEAANAESKKSNETVKTMRVQEERIDLFLSLVGEMIGTGETLGLYVERFAEGAIDSNLVNDYKRTVAGFKSLSGNLEHAVMSIRKVALKGMFQKVPRLVRDIAGLQGKDVEVQIVGDDVEVDKSLIELVDAPLTHMVRNAVDHGIERPDIRLKAGKPERGRLNISCVETDKHIVLVIEDDGAGLNFDGLRAKGESLGLFRPGQDVSRDELVQLIFMAGVSTAQEVSDISGRGVGMDVVKRMIESSGGSIEVDTRAGEGTKFTIKITKTVTTQIMHGLMVESTKQRFMLPLERIVDSLYIPHDKFSSVPDFGPCVEHYGTTIPLIDLRTVCHEKTYVDSSNRSEHGQLVVTIQSDRHLCAVAVDNVCSITQFVLKNFDYGDYFDHLFMGGAVLGSGEIALVMDIDRLVDRRMGREYPGGLGLT